MEKPAFDAWIIEVMTMVDQIKKIGIGEWLIQGGTTIKCVNDGTGIYECDITSNKGFSSSAMPSPSSIHVHLDDIGKIMIMKANHYPIIDGNQIIWHLHTKTTCKQDGAVLACK